MKDAFYIGIIILACIVFWRVMDSWEPETVTEVQKDTVLVKDTVTVQDTLKITEVKAKLDTVKITKKDTVFQRITVAKADTTINNDSIRAKVSYYFPPANFFDIMIDTKLEVIEKTLTEFQTITETEPFYENGWFYSTVGSLAIILSFLVGGNL